ncbi:3beta-hydroxysteroid-dehydrogenase/decarboxylase isoform X1 [Senna tora]|uniref:Reticulon-like protein n=1 Tax=Senna tora TaxID=362788 RepID=A0A834TN29_9FABA|nr:3beta-hydroxysteroid-dehydrogenase/decarboxylase isoform X1 [Senna tora]
MAVDDRLTESNHKTCAVLGGSGFVGRSLALRLLKQGNWIVRIADSPQSFELDHSHRDSVLAQALASGRASYSSVHLRDKRQIVQVIEGCSVVFFMDHDVDLNTNDFYSCYMLIVQGTKNLINACWDCRVKRLIYNSSADVIFDGLHDMHDEDESLSCPWKIENMLSDLKAQAEAMILGANDIDGLSTCALRPSNVFGPGDSELVPFILKLAKSGWAKYLKSTIMGPPELVVIIGNVSFQFIIGTGNNLSDFTYSENVAHAHICAEEALDFRKVSVAGKAFFVTNFEPMKFWEFISLLLEGLGYQRPSIKLPVKMVEYILLLVKRTQESLGTTYLSYPLLVHFFRLASHNRTFNCTAAKKDIGYSPVVSLQWSPPAKLARICLPLSTQLPFLPSRYTLRPGCEEGITLTIEAFSHLARGSSLLKDYDSTEQSKAEKLLGGGKVADILLWRDEATSFTYFVVLVMLFYWFFLSGRTFTSSAATLLLLSTVLIYGYGFLPSKLFGFPIQRMSLSSFKISEEVVRDSVATAVYLWNKGFQNIKILAQGNDWSMFFKVAVFLYFLKLILSEFLTTSIGIALVFAFTAFFIYEQYESEIDGVVGVLVDGLKESMAFLTRNLPDSLYSVQHNRESGREKKLR